jgi:hypothetical protein
MEIWGVCPFLIQERQHAANPCVGASAELPEAFTKLAAALNAQLLSQTWLKDLDAAISYERDEDTQTIKGDLSWPVQLFSDKLAAGRDQGKTELATFIINLTYTHTLQILNTWTFQQQLELFDQDVTTVVGLAFRGLVATPGNDRLTGDDTNSGIHGLHALKPGQTWIGSKYS